MKTFVILAAGNSTRFGSNKLLEKIGDYTLPQHAALFALENGAERICVTVNRKGVYTNGSKISHRVVDDLERLIPNELEIAFQDDTMYGPGAALLPWRNKIKDEFVVLFGDNYYYGTLSDLPSNYCGFTYKSKVRHPDNLRLAAVIDDYIVEKPHGQLEGNFFCGYIQFPKDYWEDYTPQLNLSQRGEYEIADLVNVVPDHYRVSLGLRLDKWFDITTKEDLVRIREEIDEDYLRS
ncbi:MAG: NTP transferase domain-containing protein [Nitrososphaeraceae archaeon]|nr:NTP transferase domain-containing protein [Nitrososphaeraceae archaeon]